MLWKLHSNDEQARWNGCRDREGERKWKKKVFESEHVTAQWQEIFSKQFYWPFCFSLWPLSNVWTEKKEEQDVDTDEQNINRTCTNYKIQSEGEKK